MADPAVEKVPHGFRIDGVDLLRANCGCGGLTGPGGAGIGDCCMTYSTVKAGRQRLFLCGQIHHPQYRNEHRE